MTSKHSFIANGTNLLLFVLLSCFKGSLALIARSILFVTGWHLLDERVFERLTLNQRVVIVFSHTSYADFWILSCYLLAYPQRLHCVRTLIKPQVFKYADGPLRYLGAIPATRLEDKGHGAVERIITELNSVESFMFLICPKGTILKKEWRSGYLNIAKGLNCPLMVAGLDYERKQVVASWSYPANSEEKELVQALQTELSRIVPLYPEREICSIRRHNPNLRGVINLEWFLLLCVGCAMFYSVLRDCHLV